MLSTVRYSTGRTWFWVGCPSWSTAPGSPPCTWEERRWWKVAPCLMDKRISYAGKQMWEIEGKGQVPIMSLSMLRGDAHCITLQLQPKVCTNITLWSSLTLTVVAHFLISWWHVAHDGSAWQLEVGSLVVRVSGHEEELLLETDERLHSGHVLDVEKAVSSGVKCSVLMQSLYVEATLHVTRHLSR